MTRLLSAAARHGRLVLIGGLVLGIAAPVLAEVFARGIVLLIATMLFLGCLRLGPAATLPRRGEWSRTLTATLLLQAVLPLVGATLMAAAGWLETPLGIGAALVLAAAPITGTPGLALLCGADATTAMRQLSVGTALLPLTALPVFWLLPTFPDPGAVAMAAARLLVLVAAAAALAALVRRLVPALCRPEAGPAIDGATTIVMALVVVGLMSAVGPALLALDPLLAFSFALAFALHLGLAAAGWYGARGLPAPEAAGLCIAAANRNLALFLVALPAEQTADLLLFVGCYQVPMYLTPLTLPRLLRWPRLSAAT